ncbi:MAG: hypothetical protein AUH25_01765 [Thaumarchaeota archaeon 13_1_40CM_38_12]|nr:MAG: hypothetical protein AUH25_01765 [Thaumarchaeota archaeon 13_1_40CM_38_12]
MKYFWWRFLDYATGVFVGGIMAFLVSKFICQRCLGYWTPILFLAVWVSFMLVGNFLFQKARPRSISQDT